MKLYIRHIYQKLSCFRAHFGDQTSDHDADKSSDEDNTSDINPPNLHSIDNILEELCGEEADQLPFSPPQSSRFSKREKVRRNSGQRRVPKAKEGDKTKKPKPVLIRERYSESNALFSGLAHVDSDADLERGENREMKEKRKRDREEKNKSKARHLEILNKREDMNTISENIVSNTAPMDINTPVVPVIKLEGSGRFVSLGQNANRHFPVSPLTTEKLERRPAVSVNAECPENRKVFFKTFQALINMGSSQKHKEKKEKERMFPQRQKSAEEDLYMSIIWTGLQAWLNGMSIQEQHNLMDLEREKIPYILNEIMDFRVQFPPSFYRDNSVDSSRGSDSKNRDSNCSVDTNVTDITETYHTMFVNQEMIQQQQLAVVQVERLLGKLDKCEQLFPHAANFALKYPKYNERTFVHRTEALYLWLNTTKDLCHKMNILGQVFNISAEQGWPYINLNHETIPMRTDQSRYRDSIPEIVQDEDYCDDDDDNGCENASCGDDDENEDEDVQEEDDGTGHSGNVERPVPRKRVSFKSLETNRFSSVSNAVSVVSPHSPVSSPKRDLSPSQFGSPPDYSTPLRGFSSASLSRASSEASLDDTTRSLYRAYVDKGLKKMGLTKMLVRLRDILYTSLRRARQSLEQRSNDPETSVKVWYVWNIAFCYRVMINFI